MNIQQIVNIISATSMTHAMVNTCHLGDIGEFNAITDNDYPSVMIDFPVVGNIDGANLKYYKLAYEVHDLLRVDIPSEKLEICAKIERIGNDIFNLIDAQFPSGTSIVDSNYEFVLDLNVTKDNNAAYRVEFELQTCGMLFKFTFAILFEKFTYFFVKYFIESFIKYFIDQWISRIQSQLNEILFLFDSISIYCILNCKGI